MTEAACLYRRANIWKVTASFEGLIWTNDFMKCSEDEKPRINFDG